ncbi:HAD-IIIA family hydrolase [Paenibacillus guangzhouensis]|uniref:HAD-IIIA family hydrolase n=1 Tax=Paenibacillus guangzhouensis TaxID=1473112 RepID=UPI001266B16B|nr:HAD-IIIA family hydrolase [Paenibacillus guangzhouensis]
MEAYRIDAIFIDRDGTIGGSDEALYPGDFELFSCTKTSIERLKTLKTRLYGFTNQPGISRGEVSREEFEQEMKAFGFDGIYICPHQHTEGCECRKPKSGMLLKAAVENQIELTKCIVIGDRWSDMLAAYHVGCSKILVLTGAGNDALNKYRYKWSITEPDYIAKDFEDATDYIMNLTRGFEEDRVIL